MHMNAPIRSVAWEAPAHNHFEKGGDWFWVLGILSFSAGAAAFFFGNYLFAVLIILSALVAALVTSRKPPIIEFVVSSRGIRIDETLYPYSTLDAFYIDEDDPMGPQLLIRSKKLFMHLIVCPIPEDAIDEIEDILETRLPEEFLEEPFATKLLESLGF